MSAQKKRLGRGLAALIGDDVAEERVARDTRGMRTVAVADLVPGPFNPRRHFDEEELAELAASIAEKGLLQPILVRPGEGGMYEIVAGERRWRAAQKAGVHEVPVIVRALSESEALEVALIENVQRSDLNPLEEAQGYARLIEQFGYTQQQLAEIIGKSRSHVANTLRLLNLPEQVREMVRAGELSAGHARALVAVADAEELARKIARLGLSVREAERLAQEHAEKDDGREAPSSTSAGGGKRDDANVRALVRELEEALGVAVDIRPGRRGGRITLRYDSLEQLDDICRRLAGVGG